MKTKDLKPKENNPRKISDSALAKLAKSIERDPEFMELRPIVIDKGGVIVGGNQRYLAIKKLGMKEIPDSWVAKAETLTEDQLKRFVLVDNAPPGMSGDWDFATLEMDWDLPDLEELGFETTMHIDGVTELEDIDDGEIEKPEKRNLGEKKYQIKPVLYSESVAAYEKAILSTGEQNYAKALMKICEFYLEHSNDIKG